MRITDQYENIIGLGSDLHRDTFGIVFKTSKMFDDRPMLGLIIPKFMLGYEFKSGDQPKEQSIPISGKKCLNETGKYWSSKITVKNYITVRPYLNQNTAMPVYTQGDKVIVTMVDNDIKSLAFYPFSINRLGQRKTDVVWFGVPANKKENTEVTEDNSYYIKIDSINKQIFFATSKKNGEVCEHVFGMDSKVGKVIISDSKQRSWEMNFQKDSVTTKTSGTKVEQIANTINVEADIINFKGKSEINMKTSTLNINANTIKSKSDDVDYNYSKFQQTTTNGTWKSSKAEWQGNSFSINYSKYSNDSPLLGMSGKITFPTYFVTAMKMLGSAADLYPSGAGSGNAATGMI